MAEGVLGLGGGGSSGLSNEVINKLKEAERKSTVAPIETKLENWDIELEKVTGIEAKVAELLAAVKPFDLFNSEANAFQQMTATTTGESAVFDSNDISSLIPGNVSVNITQLAQKDVHESTSTFSDKTATIATATGENLLIDIGTNNYSFSIDDKTYEELADEINLKTDLTASVEEVGDGLYKLVIKSKDTGTANNITITPPIGPVTGLDSFTESLDAKNMQGTIDNVSYDVSSNKVTTQGNLDITAVSLGLSSISIQQDTSPIVGSVEALLTTYNELVDLIDAEAYGTDSPVEDMDSLQAMMTSIKEMFFSTYNTVDGDPTTDKNAFNIGFELDKLGHVSLDKTVFAKALSDDFDSIALLFTGVAEDKGLGTVLKEFIDDLNSYDGLLSVYDANLIEKKTSLEKEKTDAIEDLDSKYEYLSMQFASYGTLIAQMEASFGGLKMMIAEATSS